MEQATGAVLERACADYLDYTDQHNNSDCSEQNRKIIEYVMKNYSRDSDGRIVVPALWNDSVKHLLPNNFDLAEKIVRSLYKKLKKDPSKLEQYDQIIKDQINSGVIAPAGNIDDLRNSSSCSFLAHNAVFRQNAESTKCRIVYLSNLCENKGGNSLSHNQISLPGHQLNPKITTALTLLRFNKYLLIFDLEKAFHQLRLREEDAEKLHFLWFKDISAGDLSLVAYKFLRVPFGMRFSPFLLMISLYIILVHETSRSQAAKNIYEMVYNLAYMDNMAYSSNIRDDLAVAYDACQRLLSSYGFTLQQCYSNACVLDPSTASQEPVNNSTKLLGLVWEREQDNLCAKNTKLDETASTKRKVLATLHSIYDPLGFNVPSLNRARFFLHKLQCDANLTWDKVLDDSRRKEWKLIAKQFNSGRNPTIPRCMGNYNSTYTILTFTDASRDGYGCVTYLQEAGTGRRSFLAARNKLVKEKSTSPTIPVLELTALRFGAANAIDWFNEFASASNPIKIDDIRVFSDSTISLNWLASKSQKFDKIERKGVLINNNLDEIMKLCDIHPIYFSHVQGESNPADFVTRCVSRNRLVGTNFLVGPDTLPEEGFMVPYALGDVRSSRCFHVDVHLSAASEPLIPYDRYSSFVKYCKVIHLVRFFAYTCIERVKSRRNDLFKNFPADKSMQASRKFVIRAAQIRYYPNLLAYFNDPSQQPEPPIVSQLNLFRDREGLVRVRCKFRNLNAPFNVRNPVLFSKDCELNRGLIWDLHLKLRHAGVYRILAAMRRDFWMPSAFRVVKKCISACLVCRKVNARPLNINQNDFKDYRINPVEIPFREVAMDHIGPFTIKTPSGSAKIYILIITCLWSRAINLLVCKNIDTESFLLAFQLHIFDFGIPQRIVSDNGSPITASYKFIAASLTDPDVQTFLEEHQIKVTQFCPYPPGASYLGGVVESLVKQVKRIMNAAIGNIKLTYDHFLCLVQECKMLINKRPVAFKSILVNHNVDKSVDVITPELLVRGYDIPSIPLIIGSSDETEDDPDWQPREPGIEELFQRTAKLRKVKAELNRLYYDQFLQNLRDLSSYKSGRYKHKHYLPLQVGDVVAVKQALTKPFSYPVGVVTSVEMNDINEVVAAELRKANGETIRRHTTDLIMLEKGDPSCIQTSPVAEQAAQPMQRPERRAAKRATAAIKDLAIRHLS